MTKEKESQEAQSKKENQPQPADENADTPKEIGGRTGPEPTRYGDWEIGGKCVDF